MTFLREYNNVMSMKRILFSFLILAMLTPMLVCGTGFGVEKAQAAAPCHGEQTGDTPDGVMFMLDCMGVEFQAASGDISIETPDQNVYKVSYISAHESLSYSFCLVGQKLIRGPPEWESITNISPSLILMTQRFRI